MTREQPISTRPQDLPTKAELARLRVEYGKDERLAFLGHLEVLNTVERSIRRAGLPFSIGNGFARRMRIQFSGALPVGASSACEYFDLRLTERVDPVEALSMLAASSPSALAPVRAAYVDGSLPALEAWLNRATWEVEVLASPFSADALEDAVRAVRERGTLTYLRGEKEKVVDVASCLVGFSARSEGGSVRAVVETRSGQAGSLRPDVLLRAAEGELGLEGACALRVRRLSQLHEEDGRLVEPL